MKALIVDDQVTSLKILRHYLEAQGGSVLEACNGAEALKLAGEENPDIIISDAQMPVMDGFQLLREIRQRPDLVATPFIFYSAVYTGKNDMALALSLGADAFIVKPKEPEEFWAELKSSLSKSKEIKHMACEKLLLDEETFLRKYNAVVTEHLAETVQNLRASEDLFTATFEQAAVGMAQVELNGRWLDFNSKLCEITGYSRAELSSLTFQVITHPEDLETDLDYLQRLLANEITSYKIEKRYLRKDGGIVWVNLSVSLLRTPQGAPKCFISVIEDISQRKQAKEEARVAQRKYLNLLHLVADGMIITDEKGMVTLLNQAAEKLPGLLREAALDKLVEDALLDQGLGTHIRNCLGGTGSGVPLDVQLLDSVKNEVRNIQAVTSVALNAQEQATGSITLLRDVTAERASDRLKSEFISTAAHELRTPLTSVMGYAELLLGMGDDNEAIRKEGLSIIVEKAQVLTKIVNDLLDLSRVESGRTVSLDRVECDLGELLSRIVQEYRRDIGNRKFDLFLSDTSLIVNADPLKISQVIENLLNNAVKFSTQDSPIRVRCEVLGDEVQVSVRDEGIGMTVEQTKRAFEKFYRVDASNTARQGLGLGLAIAKNIVEAHGGRIWLNSEQEQGTEVRFSLPVSTLPP